MINHARTLLLNRPGDANTLCGPWPGDEYCESEFRPVSPLPQYLQTLRRLLFTASPDRVYANYRVRQYLAVLQATELQEFVRELDPRITYEVNNPVFLSDALFQPVIVPELHKLLWLGERPNLDAVGRSFQQWRVVVAGPAVVTATLQHGAREQTVTSVTSQDDGWSTPAPLPGTSQFIRLANSTLPAGQAWTLTQYIRPQKDLSQIVYDLRTAGETSMNALFGVGSPLGDTEPFQTFRNLWLDHTELPYALGGVLLAIIYRMEAIRRGQK